MSNICPKPLTKFSDPEAESIASVVAKITHLHLFIRQNSYFCI